MRIPVLALAAALPFTLASAPRPPHRPHVQKPHVSHLHFPGVPR